MRICGKCVIFIASAAADVKQLKRIANTTIFF